MSHPLAIRAFAALVGAIGAGAHSAEIPPPNPPRTQQDLAREREAACRDLHGPELKECMANYIGTPDKSPNPQSDRGTPGNGSDKPPAPIPPPKDGNPGTGEASKK